MNGFLRQHAFGHIQQHLHSVNDSGQIDAPNLEKSTLGKSGPRLGLQFLTTVDAGRSKRLKN